MFLSHLAVFQMLMGRSFILWSEHLLRAVSLGVEEVEFLAPQVQRMGDPPPLNPPLFQELHTTVMQTTMSCWALLTCL